MPDNTIKIASIRALLESGVTTHSEQGRTTTVDPDELRIELARLVAENTATGATKKRLFKPIRMGDFAE